MNPIRIATRASQLALAQANQVKSALSVVAPGIPISIVTVNTKGDRDISDFLYKSESVGFFTSEIEQVLLSGQADIAVHSLKDLPTSITKGLLVAAIPQREQVCDVIVAPKKISSIHDLPKNASVGTSSLRRITQLKLLRPDLNCQPLRGNVETRVRKVQEGQMDAIVLAQAGLSRLGLSEQISLVLPPDEFIPAPGQGALAIQTRQEDVELCKLIAKLEDPLSRLTTQTERHILGGLHGGCSIPLGVYCRIDDDIMRIHVILCNLAATYSIKKVCSCSIDKATETAADLTEEILNEGGKQILEELRSFKEFQ
jgi:hydroxymethylbilane synthase